MYALKNIFTVLVVSGCIACAYANPVSSLLTSGVNVQQNRLQPLSFTQMQFGQLPHATQNSIANRWGLKIKDYSHYLWLMQHTPDGKWYPQLDPSEVLGISAKSDTQRQYYAIVDAKMQHERVKRELLMQLAYDKAFRELYPHEKPIALGGKLFSQTHQGARLNENSTLLLFTKINNTLGNELLPSVLAKLKTHSHLKLNVFIVGEPISDAAIQKWAKDEKIPANVVASGQVTLNHDRGRFEKLHQSAANLPLLYAYSNGQYQLLDWSALWS